MTEARTAIRGGRRGTLRVLQPPRLRLGLSTGALYPTPTEDVPDLAARAGLFDLEIMLQTPGEYGAGFIRELAAPLQERWPPRPCRPSLGKSCTPSSHLCATRPRRAGPLRAGDRRRRRAGREGGHLAWPKRADVQTAADQARFSTQSPTVGKPVPRLGSGWRSRRLLVRARDCARCVGVSVSLRELDPRAERIGYVFDPFQADEAGANPFMVLAAMEERVFDVHLSDRREGDPDHRHLPPGEGDLPWPALLRAIAGVYSGPLMLEGIVGEEIGRIDATRRELDPLLREIPAGARDAVRRRAATRVAGRHPALQRRRLL